MEQPIQMHQQQGGGGVGGGKNLPLGPVGVNNLSPEGLLSGREQGSKPNGTSNNSNNNCSSDQQQGNLPQGRVRHDSSRAFGCVPGSPAMRPKSPHPANSYGNAKSPWNSNSSNYSPASPFPQTPSPAHSFNPSCPPSPFSPRDRHTNTYLGNTPMRAVGDLAHNSIVDMKDGCFKAPPTPSSMGSSPATPAPNTPETSNLQNNSPTGEVPNSPVTLPGKSPPRGSEFVNSPSSVSSNQNNANAKSNPILNELLSDTKHAASRQVGSPGGGLIQSPNPIQQQQQQHQIQQQMLHQQQQVQMDIDSSRDSNTATPSPQNIHLQQQRFVGMPSQQPNSQAALQHQQQFRQQQQQQQFHQQQMYMKQQQHQQQQQQQINQQRLLQQSAQRMNSNGQQQGPWMSSNSMQPMQQQPMQQQPMQQQPMQQQPMQQQPMQQQPMQQQPMQQQPMQQRQMYQQQQQQPQMYGQPQQQQYSMHSMPPQGQPGAPPPSYFDSVGWNNGQQQQPPSPQQQQRQFDLSSPPQYNGNGSGGRVVIGESFSSNPRGQQQQFNSVQTASFNGGGWYPGTPQQSFAAPTQQQSHSVGMQHQLTTDGFAVPMPQMNGRIPVRAQQQNGGSNLPLSLPNNSNNGGPPMSPQQTQSPFLRPLPPGGSHFVKPHPPSTTSPYHRSAKSIASDSLSMSEDTYRVLLADLSADGSLQCDKSDFDQYILVHNPDPQELRNRVRENNEQFKDIVEILGPSVLESRHLLASSLLNDSLAMNVDECSSPALGTSPMDTTVGKDSEPKMRLDDFYIPQSKWIEAFKRKNIVKSAEILFRCLFSDEEIINCTIKGKGETRVLDPCKKVAIIRAVSWIDSNSEEGAIVDPLTYNCLAALECTLTPENKKNVEKKIFTSYRNQLKIKLTKVKGKVQQDGKEQVLTKLKRPFPFPPDTTLDS